MFGPGQVEQSSWVWTCKMKMHWLWHQESQSGSLRTKSKNLEKIYVLGVYVWSRQMFR